MFKHSEVGTGEKVFKLNPKIATGSIRGLREREIIITANVRGNSKNVETKNSFCHLVGNFGTTTFYLFRLLSRASSTIYFLIPVLQQFSVSLAQSSCSQSALT